LTREYGVFRGVRAKEYEKYNGELKKYEEYNEELKEYNGVRLEIRIVPVQSEEADSASDGDL
jgi:hypothetical protein